MRCEIVACPTSRHKEALRVLHDGLPCDLQLALVATLDSLRGDNDSSLFDELLVARENGAIKAASWIQRTPGNSAVLWPPDLGHPAAELLMDAAGKRLDCDPAKIAQLVVGQAALVDESLLSLAGFHKLADLAYLSLESSKFDQVSPPATLRFESVDLNHPRRFEGLVSKTYEQTQDCPELNGLREPAEILADYKTQGEFDTGNWLIAQDGTLDVGVLILARHGAHGVMELVYMGVVPAARGRGYGAEIVGQSAQMAARQDAQRLVLAVDLRNQPARTMYESIGFSTWDQRTVYARLASNTNTSPSRF